MSYLDYEAGLIIPVPQAEALVSLYREQFDKSAAKGVPAHITVNYPFSSYQTGTMHILDNLQQLFARYLAFEFSLKQIRCFPNSIYLAPEPEQPFIQLAEAVYRQFPNSPPYEGKFDSIIPHLTVGEFENPVEMDRILAEFTQKSKQALPIEGRVEAVMLMDNRDGVWKEQANFDLLPFS